MKRCIAPLFFSVIVAAFACKKKSSIVQPAFYFWKSNSYQLSAAERKYIDTLQIQKLYVKIFEVDVDPVFGNVPISKTNIQINKWDTVTAEIVPVVFIKNEVLQNISNHGMDSLADNILNLVNRTINTQTKASPREIQIDCDWTERTKNNYFSLLTSIKKQSGKTVSVTLRLYPYKYSEKMGIPPADKAMLMCYNLVNALTNESKNSILDINELKLFMNHQRKYPLHLDIALPAYSWMLLYQNEKLTGIISQQSEAFLENLAPINKLWYEVIKDTLINEYYLRKGDRIKYENITEAVLEQAAGIIRENTVLSDSVTVSIFHLDEQKLNSYSYEILHNVYTTFNK